MGHHNSIFHNVTTRALSRRSPNWYFSSGHLKSNLCQVTKRAFYLMSHKAHFTSSHIKCIYPEITPRAISPSFPAFLFGIKLKFPLIQPKIYEGLKPMLWLHVEVQVTSNEKPLYWLSYCDSKLEKLKVLKCCIPFNRITEDFNK